MPQPPWYIDRAQHARILRKIEHRPAPEDAEVEGDCWIWTGDLMPNGYGKYAIQGKRVRAVHRILWEVYNGQEVPAGLELDHLCRVRSCCRPGHLEPVTHAVNTQRQAHYNRGKDTCPKGHPYTPENTITSGGRRWCKTCRAEQRASTRVVPTP